MKTFIEYLNEETKQRKTISSDMFLIPSPKKETDKMHSTKLMTKEKIVAGAMTPYQTGDNSEINRKFRERSQLDFKDQKKFNLGLNATKFSTALQDILGRNSHDKPGRVTDSAIVFHGQTHAPDIVNGVITNHAFTSWSTKPGTAMQFVKGKGSNKGIADSHHIFVMHYDPENAAGHGLFSLVPLSHSSASRRDEEELIGGPVKYQVLDHKIISDPKTGIPILHPDGLPVHQYEVYPYQAHPNWNSRLKGFASEDDLHKFK